MPFIPLAQMLRLPSRGRIYYQTPRSGANATLLPGVIIGRKALVGAGSVVVCDVPDGKVVVGNPAHIIRDISELTAYQVESLRYEE